MVRDHHNVLVALSALALITSGALSAAAQSTAAPVPENARMRSYGGGWDCDQGLRPADGACVAVVVPENAYATNKDYGRGWQCDRGFDEVEGKTCTEIAMPPQAYLVPSGTMWSADFAGSMMSARRSLSRSTGI
jgi:hypothetical protein